MGNSVMDGSACASTRHATITKFYTSAAWIEGRAEDQLTHVAGWEGVEAIAAFPDLHPGKYGPVGCAVLADRLYPQLIGNDIGCGMSLFVLDLQARKLRLDKAMRRLRDLGNPGGADAPARLEAAGLSPDLFASSLGTVGGGNHFCEVQRVATAESGTGLDTTRLHLLIHSGSRGLGTAVLNAVPPGGFEGLMPSTAEAQAYQAGHDAAVTWARLNRQILAERVTEALRTDLRLLTDAPHNLLEPLRAGFVHRKGAASAGSALVPLAGSRASPSYLMQPLHHPDALGSLAHGAGRRYDRASMHGRVRGKRSDLEAMERTPFGGRVLCEDRDLLIEEAPQAYKSAKAVMADLEACNAATQVAELHPLITFKKVQNRDETHGGTT